MFLEHQDLVDLYQYVHPKSRDEFMRSFAHQFEGLIYSTYDFPCGLCGQDLDWIPVAKTDRIGTSGQFFSWEVCANCGLLQIRRRLSHEQTDRFYQSGDYHALCMADLPLPDHWNLYSKVAGPDLALNLRLLGLEVRGSSVLDVGFGPGAVLKYLRDSGAVVRGFDLDPRVVEYGKRFINEIEVGNAFDDINFDGVDIVYLGCVLPHLFDPVAFLRKVHAGFSTQHQRLVLSMPNLDFAFAYSSESFTKFLHIGHIWYFNALTIERCLNSAGFVIKGLVPRDATMTVLACKVDQAMSHESTPLWNTVGAINFANLRTSAVGEDIAEELRRFFSPSLRSRVSRRLRRTLRRFIAERDSHGPCESPSLR